MEPEILVPFPETLPQAPETTHLRSTLLVTSLAALRRRALLEPYERHTGAERFAAITTAVAGMWLPIDVGVAHYASCDALGLSHAEQMAIGGEVVRELQRSFIGTLLKLSAAGAGVTPWLALARFSAVYERMFQGGGLRVVKTGPKDARMEVVGQRLARVGYFRNAYRGFLQAGCEFFSDHVFVADLPRHCTASTLGYRISWV